MQCLKSRFFQQKSVYIISLLTQTYFIQQGYDCCDYTFVPGVIFPDHTHDVTKRDAVISGRFLIGMGSQEVILEAGDSVLIPAGAVHNAKVIGSEPVLFIDASKR